MSWVDNVMLVLEAAFLTVDMRPFGGSGKFGRLVRPLKFVNQGP